MPRLTEVEGGENLPLIKMFAMLFAREIIILCTFMFLALSWWVVASASPSTSCLPCTVCQ